MIRPKLVEEVETFDGRTHEVDIRHRDKTITAWGFVDKKLIEGKSATTRAKALSNWKALYEATFPK